MFGTTRLRLADSERLVRCNETLLGRRHLLVGMTRVRNESLIPQDTLNYVASFADAIVAYDDASTDETRSILKSHPKMALVIENDAWEEGSVARLRAETRHRALLLSCVRKHLDADWLYCFDADERVVGELRDFVGNVTDAECNGVRVRLFDAYLTPDDCVPLAKGASLLHSRRYFGPERRDILMLWRNSPSVEFRGLDSREPVGAEKVVTNFYCQHYGKAISTEQWESTCDYYARHFPFESYGEKWLRRKGRAIHVRSDFSRPLYEWGAPLFDNSTRLLEDSAKEAERLWTRTPGALLFLLATNHLAGWGARRLSCSP